MLCRERSPEARPQLHHQRETPNLAHNGRPGLLAEIIDSRPEVVAHNLERVPRIFKRIHPTERYACSIGFLGQARGSGHTRLNLASGIGETRRLRLVVRRVKSQELDEPADEVSKIAFVILGPMMRSSYRACRPYQQTLQTRDPDTKGRYVLHA